MWKSKEGGFSVAKHLKERGLDPSKYLVYTDEETATFLLLNPTRKLVGYHVYRPFASKDKKNDPRSGRYYTYLPERTDGLFGLERDNGVGTLFVVEGVFKAAKLHSLGFNAVAVLGATPKRMRSQFKIWRSYRCLVGIGDNDSAGAKLVGYVGRGVQSPCDLDEMSDTEVLNLVKEF